MMNYNTEQVIQLYKNYEIYCDKIAKQNRDIFKSIICEKDKFLYFEDWLIKYETSQTPVKGQMIWVRDINDTEWYQRYFSHFDNDQIACFYQCGETDYKQITLWDEYSLTDPNL